MDNLLQIQILKEDTRALFVPTSLQKLFINVKKHAAVLQKLPEEKPGNLYLNNVLVLIKFLSLYILCTGVCQKIVFLLSQIHVQIK